MIYMYSTLLGFRYHENIILSSALNEVISGLVRFVSGAVSLAGGDPGDATQLPPCVPEMTKMTKVPFSIFQ